MLVAFMTKPKNIFFRSLFSIFVLAMLMVTGEGCIEHSSSPYTVHSEVTAQTSASQGRIRQRKDQTVNRNWTYDHGGIVRGDRSEKKIALIFTGGDFGEGTPHILDELKARGIKASFFVTGSFIAKLQHHEYLRRIVNEGHYLGPHSDSHPLYAPWEDREKTLVTREFFRRDIEKNIADLRRFGALSDPALPVYFIPPYEWYNSDQSQWAKELGLVLFNFTPGSGSNRDWAPEGHKSFVPSEKIMADILAFEEREPDGLNGFLLLLHLGSERKDKMHRLIGPLLDELQRRGYSFVRVDELIAVTD